VFAGSRAASARRRGRDATVALQRAMFRTVDEIGEVLEAEDIAEAIRYAVAAPPRVAVNELLIRPAGQTR
jgi:NADP-dependent 3-hydroxy acid dehydrogenase YdfG